MGERYQLPDGRIAEKTPDGKYRVVSPAASGVGPSFGNNPNLPLQMQGNQLSNANAGVNLNVNQATQNAQIREANAKASKAEQDAVNARREGGNPMFDREKDLRSAFEAQPAVQAYKDAATSLGVMLQTPNTGGGDIQIIYNYIKSQGPGPVAQGELDLAQSVASFREGLEQKYGKLTDSNRLPPRVRRELIEASRQAVAVKRAQFDQVYEQFRSEASRNGLNAQAVTGRHPADAVRPAEEKYIRQHGQAPRSALTGDIVAADPNAKAVTRNNPERAAFIDAMIRNGVPFERAQEAYRQQFPGVPVFDNEAKWDEALGFARKHPNAAGSFGESLDTVPLSGVEQRRNTDLQSPVGSTAMLGLNALTGGIPSALAGEQGQAAIGDARENLGGFSIVPEAAGAIGATMAGTRALGTLPFLASRPGAAMLGADALYGGTYGATQNPDDPLGGAAIGAGAGVLGNQIGSRVIGPGLRAGGAMMGFNPAPALARGESLIAGQTAKADPSAVMGQLQSAADLNMPFALVDAAPQLRALGGSVVRKSPDAFALASENLGNRTLGQVDRLTGIVEGEMGPRLNLPTFKEGVKKTAQAKSRPLYESAKGQPPVDDAQLNEMLQTPAGQRAARSGYDEAINNGEPVGDLVEEVDSITGQVRLTGRPSWNVLQRMKFALDEMPDQATLARRFNGQLGKLNPDFRKANLTYAKEMRRGDIAESGYGAANPNVRPPELSASMASPKMMKDPALFRQGYGSNLIDKARGMRDSANPYEVASMASPDQLAKMQTISPGLQGKFGQARGIEGQMALTNKELFGGSPTASRIEADKLFEGGGLGGDMLQAGLEVASGTPPISLARSKLFAGRGAFGGIKDAYNFGIGKSAQQRAMEIAPSLFDPDPNVAMIALDKLMKSKAARDEYVRRTGMFGAGIGAPLAVTAYGN